MKVIIEWYDGTYSLVTDYDDAMEIARNGTAPGEMTKLHKLVEMAVVRKAPNADAIKPG